MTRKRLLGADRRASILEAATRVFAEHGLSGAKTQQIAAEAKVSEALVFRHFHTKDMLYRAVLRKLIKDQDEAFKAAGIKSEDTAGIVAMMRSYFGGCLRSQHSPFADSLRVLYASLAGDGNYARLVYRRAQRLSLKPLERALAAARQSGDLLGEPVDALNIVAFFEHIGSNLSISRMRAKPIVQYAGDDEQLLRQILWFCGRGIGLTEAALNAHVGPPTGASPPLPEPPAPAAKRSRKRSARPVDG